MDNDLISRSALLEALENDRMVFKSTITVPEALLAQGEHWRRCLEAAPAVDALEVVKKPVKGYEGYYEVDQFGRVFGVERTISVNDNGRNYKKPISGKQLKQSMHTQGYKTVSLTKNGKTKTVYVHRLVADAFIPNPNGLPMVNHKDEDKTNNFIGNLEWCTNEYNIFYGTARKRRAAKLKGQLHTDKHKQKISESLKRFYSSHASKSKGRKSENGKAVILIDFAEQERHFETLTEAANYVHGDRRNIAQCCNGKKKSAYGYKWKWSCNYGEGRSDGKAEQKE